MKKIIPTLCAFTLGAATAVAVTTFSEYTDQADISDWARESVQNLTLNTIMTGYDDGRFAPGDLVTREQLATTLDRYDQKKGRLFMNEDQVNFLHNKLWSYGSNATLPEFNQDPPNQLVTYLNTEQGTKIDIPYNSSWGTENYILEPYTASINWLGEEGIQFGPMDWKHPETLGRPYGFFYLDPENIEKYFSSSPSIIQQSEPYAINQYEITRYIDPIGVGDCVSTTMKIDGGTNVYQLVASCDLQENQKQTFELFDTMVKSLEEI